MIKSSHLLNLSTLFAVALMGAACAKKVESHPLSPNKEIYVPAHQKGNQPAMAEVIKHVKVTCAVDEDCPQNIGVVVIAMGAGVEREYGQCSGTLVGKDIVLTNSHCIPKEVKEAPENCKENLGFVLPHSQLDNKDRLLCKRVIYISSGGNYAPFEGPDYALIQLEAPLTSTPPTINTNGVEDLQNLTIYAVDPNPAQVGGVIVHKTCQAIQNSDASRSFTNPLGRIISMFGDACTMAHGNSGSAVFVDDQIVGVFSGGKGPIDSPEVKAAEARYGKPLPDKQGLATNFACADLSALSIEPNKDCEKVKSILSYNTKLRLKVEELLAQSYDEITRGASPLFKPNLVASNIPMVPGSKEYVHLKIDVQPECMKPQNFSSDPQKPSFLVEQKEVFINIEWDEYLRPVLSKQINTILISDFGKDRVQTEKVRVCTEEDLKTPFVLTPL